MVVYLTLQIATESHLSERARLEQKLEDLDATIRSVSIECIFEKKVYGRWNIFLSSVNVY